MKSSYESSSVWKTPLTRANSTTRPDASRLLPQRRVRQIRVCAGVERVDRGRPLVDRRVANGTQVGLFPGAAPAEPVVDVGELHEGDLPGSLDSSVRRTVPRLCLDLGLH